MIKITFPDGSVREYESGVTGYEIAESISQRLAQDVLACSVNDQITELNRPITTDATIKLHKWEDRRPSTHTGTPAPTLWPRHCRNSIPAHSSV